MKNILFIFNIKLYRALGLIPGTYRKSLQFTVKNILFIFNIKLYQQIDSVAMGKPLMAPYMGVISNPNHDLQPQP